MEGKLIQAEDLLLQASIQLSRCLGVGRTDFAVKPRKVPLRP
jgi:hypothetical protein